MKIFKNLKNFRKLQPLIFIQSFCTGAVFQGRSCIKNPTGMANQIMGKFIDKTLKFHFMYQQRRSIAREGYHTIINMTNEVIKSAKHCSEKNKNNKLKIFRNH